MFRQCRPLYLLLWALPLACGSTEAQERLFAEPKVSAANPYQAMELSHAKLPVAMRGFSVVELRDRQQWASGQEQFQLIFDGQLYWFAERRDLDIFAAAPQQYAPVLAGDCIVTYVDTGERLLGQLKYGLVHAGRLFFFAGEQERQQFQANPSQYANGDLANGGRCLVSQVDERKSVIGLPETVAIVNGLRYHFKGDFERRIFASDPGHYGVRRILEQSPEDEQAFVAASPAKSAGVNAKRTETKPKSSHPQGDDLEEPEEQHYAMEGYCPVSIHEQGVWVRGNYQNYADYEDNRYLLVGAKEKKLFAADPKKYVPVLGGDCIVSKADEGKVTPGSVYHSLIYEGKLYLFAGPEQVRSFKADPTKYVQPASQPEATEAPAVPPQEEAAPEDEPEPEGNVLREGRRLEFRRRTALR